MSDDEFREMASHVGRRVWGVRTVHVGRTEHAEYPDYFSGHISLWDRVFNRFELVILIMALIAVAAVVMTVVALLATH